MPFAHFESLCRELCELQGFGSPVLRPAPSGALAFSMLIDGVPVTVMQGRPRSCETALLLAELDEVCEHNALQDWLALLASNALMPRADAPRAARDFASGRPVLLWPCSLDGLTSVDMVGRIAAMVQFALQWASGHDPAVMPAVETGAEPDEASAARAAARFHSLYVQMCRQTGQEPAPACEGNELGFPMRVAGLDVAMAFVPQYSVERATIGVKLTDRVGTPRLESITSLMDANFMMGLDPDGPAICREPFDG